MKRLHWEFHRILLSLIRELKSVKLEDLVERLKLHEGVDAVAIIGSASEDNLNSASDYDVFIVLKESSIPLLGDVTHLEGRLIDINFASVEDIEHLNNASQNEIPLDSMQETIVRWMKTAWIEFDKCGCLNRLKGRAREDLQPRLLTVGELRSRWDKASHNPPHTRRMLTSDDPVYHDAIDLRLLNQLEKT